MNWPRLTAALVVALVVLAALYDLFAYSRGGYEATISRVVMDAFYGNPVLSLAVGVVIGHLAWPQPGSARYRTKSDGGILPDDPPRGAP